MRTCLLGMLLLAGTAWAQYPAHPGAMGPQLPNPLYVRFAGPPGMKVTFFRGQKANTTLAVPFVVGVRPGYVYRLAVSGMPNYPAQVFYPTLEVRGSLFAATGLKASDFPAGLVFTDEDFAKVQAGAVIKKVVLLEKTDTALPQATQANRPEELTVLPNQDPLNQARQRGLPLLILHMGQRNLTEDEMTGIPGTILLPGERVLPLPQQMPWLPWACYALHDPLLGPAQPWPYYSLPDGGDSGLKAGYLQGKLRGLDPSDTMAEYTDSKGTKRLAVSNRVTLLVPRFLVVKGEMTLDRRGALFGTGNYQIANAGQVATGSQMLQGQQQNLHLESTRERLKAGGTDNLYRASVAGKVQGLDIKASFTATHVIDSTKTPPSPLEPPDGPLLIDKWPDRSAALVGDVVTFYLKFSNSGKQPITNVVVSDSLVTRYEYIPGSARADREGSFTTQSNEAGSLVLRWEFTGSLLPRESGLVSFQVRVR